MCSFLCVSLFKQFSDALIIGLSVTCFCLKSSRIDRSSSFIARCPNLVIECELCRKIHQFLSISGDGHFVFVLQLAVD